MLARTQRVVRGEAPGGGSPHRSLSFLVAMKEKEAVLETWGSPPLAVKKTCQAGQDNDSRVCSHWLGGEVETDLSALVGRRQRRVGGGVQRGASAV
jgi:hypothetical protein